MPSFSVIYATKFALLSLDFNPKRHTYLWLQSLTNSSPPEAIQNS